MRSRRRPASSDVVRRGAGTEGDRLALLTEHRERVRATLDAQREYLAFIDRKIESYRRVPRDGSGEENQCER